MFFRNKEVYKKSLERPYETNERVNGEFYVDTLLNTAIELGYKVKNFELITIFVGNTQRFKDL